MDVLFLEKRLILETIFSLFISLLQSQYLKYLFRSIKSTINLTYVSIVIQNLENCKLQEIYNVVDPTELKV